MSLVEQMEKMNERLENMEEVSIAKKKKKEKKLSIKIPNFLARRADKDPEVSLALVLGYNGRANFQECRYKDGLLYIADRQYAYEESAMYSIRHKKKTLPFVIVYEYRLTPVGGAAEKLKDRVLNGEEIEVIAKEMGIHSYGSQTIIRGIQHAEMDKDGMKKPKKTISMAIWILAIGVVLYFVTQMLTGG